MSSLRFVCLNVFLIITDVISDSHLMVELRVHLKLKIFECLLSNSFLIFCFTKIYQL